MPKKNSTKKNPTKKNTKKSEFLSGFDSYNLCLTGGIGRTLATPSGGLNEHIPVVVLNDQGGSVMSVSDIPATLRAESHQHEPVICFEPGIVKREGSDSRFVENMCGTLRAEMGDNQPAVCYQTPEIIDDLVYVFKERAGCPGGGKGILIAENKAFTLATNFNGAICYAIDSHPMDSRFNIEGDVSPTVTAKLAKGAADGPLVLIDHG